MGTPILMHNAGVKRALKGGPETVVRKAGEEPGVCGLLEVEEQSFKVKGVIISTTCSIRKKNDVSNYLCI